jgi:hypothetical protein
MCTGGVIQDVSMGFQTALFVVYIIKLSIKQPDLHAQPNAGTASLPAELGAQGVPATRAQPSHSSALMRKSECLWLLLLPFNWSLFVCIWSANARHQLSMCLLTDLAECSGQPFMAVLLGWYG